MSIIISAAAQFLGFTLEILVGTKVDGGPTLPSFVEDVFRLSFDDPRILVLQYAEVGVCLCHRWVKRQDSSFFTEVAVHVKLVS